MTAPMAASQSPDRRAMTTMAAMTISRETATAASSFTTWCTGGSRLKSASTPLAAEIATAGVPHGEPRYNLTWMDRLNLENLVLVSRAICAAAVARHDSRGAHFREDFPETSELAASRYTVARLESGSVAITTEPVHFTRVFPGDTLLREAAE